MAVLSRTNDTTVHVEMRRVGRKNSPKCAINNHIALCPSEFLIKNKDFKLFH